MADPNHRAAAQQRALGLLRSVLDPRQLHDLDEMGGFRVEIGDCLYWIPLSGKPSRFRRANQTLERLCVAPDRPNSMPRADVALTHLMWLRSEPTTFARKANVERRYPLEGPIESEEHLIEVLRGRAMLFPRRTHPGRRRSWSTSGSSPRVPPIWVPPIPGPPMSEEERRTVDAAVLELRTRLKTMALRDKLGPSVSEETVAGIARRLLAG